MQAVIFDFNGTMFLDKEFHKAAWLRYAKELGFKVTVEQVCEYMIGPANDDIFRWLYGHPLPEEESRRKGEEKESIYRELCRNNPGGIRLVDGLPEALDAMKAAGVNMTIATASDRQNLDFFMEAFGLARWFDYEKILCDDGTVPQKPDPTIYREAAKLIGVTPADCMIVEDSMTGYRSAYAAGAGEIAMLDTTIGRERVEALPGVKMVLHDFYGFEKLFC